MAQKQYSFDFVLNAVLNGGFSGTFTKAQQEFVRLGNEIKNLQAIQRDVKAYEKQAAAVQNTTAKLENLGKQYELVKKEISETTGSTSALEREKLKLEQRIANTSMALDKQKEKLDITKERLDAAGISTSELAGKEDELKAKIQELTEQQKKAAEGAGEFQNRGVQAIEAVGGAIAAAGIAEKVRAISDAYKKCVEAAGNFGQNMSAVEGITDSSVSEMKALKAEAKDLGATTRFTAQQSGNAMEYMAMAGWDAQEMLSGMAGMTTLAAAAGEDLAQVSDIVTDNLTAFGLKASDTAHFADVLAAAAAKSNTNISIMGETFKGSSSVAGALGYSIEDVAVMVGLMANSAVKGSRAGTALRNIFNGLLGGVTLTAEAFGELEYSAVNYDGSMKGLMETVKDLRGYFEQMTEAERVNNAMAIAGMRGYNGLLAILNATDEDFQSLYTSINNCSGAAERMAAVKLDNLNGDITIANSALEALQITIGEQFTPELRELTQLKTELLNGVNDFIRESPELSKGIMAGTGAFMALGTAVVGVNAAIKVFKALKLATLFTGPAGTLLGIAGGIAAVTAAAVTMSDSLRDGGKAVRELTEAAREMNATMEEVEAAYEDTAVEILATANTADFYIGKLEEIERAEGKNASQNREYQNTLALLLRTVPELSDSISQTTDEYGRSTYALETDTDALRANTEEWKKNAKARAYQDYLNSLYDSYGDVLREAAENEIGLTMAQHQREAAAQGMQDTYRALLAALNMTEAQFRSTYNTVEDIPYRSVSKEVADLRSQYIAYSKQLFDSNNAVRTHEQAIEDDAEAIAEAEERMASAEEMVRSLTEAMDDYADSQDEISESEAAVQDVLDGTLSRVQELTDAYTEAYNEAVKSFSEQFGLFDEAKADADATVEAAQKALDTQLAYWQGYASNIAILKEQSADSLHVTEENYNALMEYVRNGTPEAAALAADMVKAINDGNTQAITDLADTQGKVKAAQERAAQGVAEWTEGLSEQVDQLISDMEEDIAALDMSAEAENYGRMTIQSYVNAAERMLPQVQNAFEDVARRARRALSNALVESSDWDGSYLSIPGHANGTSNAPPGWAWVGEEGPELMRLRGGEQILPNSVSQKVAEDYSMYSRYAAREVQYASPPLEVTGAGHTTVGAANVEMHFHIEAGASPETVDAWQEYALRGELKAVVLEVMDDAEADARRRALI